MMQVRQVDLKQPLNNGLCDQEDDAGWQGLLADVRSGRCVAFIGSGCSRPIYGSWREFVTFMAKRAGELAPDSSVPPRTFPDILQKCKAALDARGYQSYCNALREFLDPQDKDRYRDIHAALVHANLCSYVTTNYDNCIENAGVVKPNPLKPDAVQSYPRDTLRTAPLTQRYVIHIHGRAYDGTGAKCLLPDIVVTRDDFTNAYKRSDVTALLRTLITEHCVVFVGFSAEDGILEMIIQDHVRPWLDGLLNHPHPPKQDPLARIIHTTLEERASYVRCVRA